MGCTMAVSGVMFCVVIMMGVMIMASSHGSGDRVVGRGSLHRVRQRHHRHPRPMGHHRQGDEDVQDCAQAHHTFDVGEQWGVGKAGATAYTASGPCPPQTKTPGSERFRGPLSGACLRPSCQRCSGSRTGPASHTLHTGCSAHGRHRGRPPRRARQRYSSHRSRGADYQ